MAAGKTHEVVFIRAPIGSTARAESLLPAVRADHVGMRVTRSTVFRLALLRGLSELERAAVSSGSREVTS